MQLSQPSRNDASSSSDPAQSDPNVTVVSSDIVVAVAANNGDGTSHEITPAVEGAIAGPSVDSGGPTECIICLTEMDDSGEDPTRTLVCGHRFHTACVSEWLSKDGRCPTCRHQIQEVAARQVPPVLAEGVLGDINASRASMHAMAMLMLESRRLMMLATMEAALAVLVMSYVEDLFSPALMIMGSSVTFLGASNYQGRAIGMARPILAINALYHAYMMARIIYAQDEDVPFFSEEYGSTRSILLSLGCVTIMEVAMLKKAGAFHQRLALMPPNELRTLRTSRRAHTGMAHRLIVLVMFVLICAPVIARYMGGESRRTRRFNDE